MSAVMPAKRRRRRMFSTSMTASSTTTPSATTKPPIVIVFRLKPKLSRIQTVASSDNGIETNDTSAPRQPRRVVDDALLAQRRHERIQARLERARHIQRVRAELRRSLDQDTGLATDHR